MNRKSTHKRSSEYGMDPVAQHPAGFPLFLPAEELEGSDGYTEGDPHDVAGGLESAFQRRRVDCTVELVGQALASRDDARLRILDLGCGEGHITEQLRQAFPAAEIWATDLSVTAVETAHATYEGIKFCVSDVLDPPYEDGFFDCVVSNNVIEHVQSPVALLEGAARVTRPGGSLVISTPSRYRLDNLVRAVTGRPLLKMSADHVSEYTVGQLRDFLVAAGYCAGPVISRSLIGRSRGLNGLVRDRLLRPLLSRGLEAMGANRYTLESTVFVLATLEGSEREDG